MGTSRSAAELGGKFASYAAAIPKANRHAVEQSAQVGKAIMLDGGVRAGLRRGGALPSSGTARWGARYDIRGTGNPTAFLRYVGPVHWAFAGTDPHVIGARGRGTRGQWRRRYATTLAQGLTVAAGGKRGRGRSLSSGRYASRSGAQALRFGGRFALYAPHPGSRGRNEWPGVKRRVHDGSVRTFREAHRNALLRSGFGR